MLSVEKEMTMLPSTEDILPPAEPQVTSTDPNERKLARRLRIERRLEAMRRATGVHRRGLPERSVTSEGEEELIEEVAEKTLVQKQLEKSSNILEKLITEAYEQVSNVRVANAGREVDRREFESIEREKIIAALEEEAKAAEEMFEDIAGKWGDILKRHDPLQIHDEMESQKEKCEALLRQKDGIIAMLREEIKKAEIKFSNDQKKQNEDITTLAARVEKQIKVMRKAYNQELNFIDRVIIEERKILIEMNSRKWEELYKKREAEERQLMEKKFEQQEEFVKGMDRIRKAHQEQFRETKIRLEHEVEELQRDFEIIKTAAIMNGEKLDYNFQILRKREDENLILNSQQKRRINKLQDVANSLRKQNEEYEEQSMNQIKKLTKEVQKLQNSVVEIETKADSLSKINDLKFKQVWQLNVLNATKKVNRIMTIDKILHEQQMGIEWKKIDTVLLSRKQLTSYSKAISVMGADSKSSAESKIETRSRDSRSLSESVSRAADTKKGTEVQAPKDPKMYNKLLKHILAQISERSGFLLEKRMDELLQPYLEEEEHLVKVDNIFAALGIKDQENIDQLCHFFLPYAKCAICIKSPTATGKGSEKLSVTTVDAVDSSESSIESYVEPLYQRMQHQVNQPEDIISDIIHELVDMGDGSESTVSTATSRTSDECMPPEVRSEHEEVQNIAASKKSLHAVKYACRFNHPLNISPAFVIRALREFLAFYFKDVSGVESLTTRMSQKHETVSRLMCQDDLKLFWQKYKTFFNTSRTMLWDSLFLGLQKYYEILKDRRKLNDEVLCLRRQNLELQRLLSTYNKGQLSKPPCAEQREIPITPEQPKLCKK